MAGRKYEQDRGKVHKTTLTVALSPSEKAQISNEAAEQGMTMSMYVRHRLLYQGKVKQK